MFKLIGNIIKFGIFSLLVIILASWIQWDGKTLSDHVQGTVHAAKAHPWIAEIQKWTDRMTHDAKKGIRRKMEPRNPNTSHVSEEDISQSERAKLRSFIQEN